MRKVLLLIFLLCGCLMMWSCYKNGGSQLVNVRYLYNSGWLISTNQQILLIDYVPDDSLNLDEFLFSELSKEQNKEKEVYIFITHEHNDHFYPPLLEWTKKLNKLKIILGWDYSTTLPNVFKVFGRNHLELNTLKIFSHISTDAGSAFLIKIADIEIYHAGDHAQWSNSLKGDFESELRFITKKASHIDIAFIPVARGKLGKCKTDSALTEGALVSIKILNPDFVFPMHVGCYEFSAYKSFAKLVNKKHPKVNVQFAQAYNQVFQIRTQ